MKDCNKCGLTKLTEDFYKDKSSKDGVEALCRNCRQETRKKHQKKYNKMAIKSHIKQAHREGWLLAYLIQEDLLRI